MGIVIHRRKENTISRWAADASMTGRMVKAWSFVSTGLLHPEDSLRYVFGGQSRRRQIISEYSKKLTAEKIAKLVGASPSAVQACMIEAEADEICKRSRKLSKSLGRSLGEIGSPEILYAICRIMKPVKVVETGVASGLSSAHILEALRKNCKGRLYSIDMPNYEEELVRQNSPHYNPGSSGILPPGLATGWIVPKELHSNWNIELGLTVDKLPALLKRLGSIDVFLHDSEHTYQNMFREYSQAWSALTNGGILLSHDVDWNQAFSDFSTKVQRKPTIIGELGALAKS